MMRAQHYIMKILIFVILICVTLSGQEPVKIPDGFVSIAYDDCGIPDKQPHLVNGQNWTFSATEIDPSVVPMDSPLRSVSHGDRVVFKIQGLIADAPYIIRVGQLSDNRHRIQKFSIDNRTMQDSLEVPNSVPLAFLFEIDPDLYADHTIELVFEKQEGPNAVVSEIELFSDDKELLPVYAVKAMGDFKGRIQGQIFDENNQSVVPGAEVKAFIGDQQIAQSHSDPEGKFTLQIDKKWRISDSRLITLYLAKDRSAQTVYITKDEVFPEQVNYIPVPDDLDGIKNVTLSLDGTWQFNPAPPREFPKGSVSGLAKWTTISVPGEWVMQGFTVKPNTFAGYFREFELPEDWKTKHIMLRCDAVYSKAEVFINGKQAGNHQGGFTPFELDVTTLLKEGRNSIALKVMNESLADTLASGTQYAAHQLGGITRKIYLYALPQIHISLLKYETQFDEFYNDAVLRIQYAVTNASGKAGDKSMLSVSLNDPEGREVARLNDTLVKPLKAGEMAKFVIDMPVKEVKKWDPEHPHLYGLSMQLSSSGTVAETIRRPVGFRQVEVKGEELYVNGRPVKLRGINRHEVHPVLGRSLNRALWKQDALLFRNANMNYIRTSHYPPAGEFIEYCDSLGLFVELEAPFVWVGHAANSTWQQNDAQNAVLFGIISRGIREMIHHYYNHPSVIIWSLANESAWGRNWENAFRLANLADPTRPKTFHDQAWGGYNSLGSTVMQIANYHYPGPDGTKNIIGLGRPLLFGEYCHLNTYNRQEIITDPGVRDHYGSTITTMYDKMYATKGCLGGAIWSGIDDVFELADGRAVGYGEWGPIDGWRREKPEYWHIKKAYSPIQVLTETLPVPAAGQPVIIEIENRHDFTDLNEIRIDWQAGTEMGGVRTSAAPRSRGSVEIYTTTPLKNGDVLRLSFHSPRGFMIDVYEFVIGKKVDPAPGRGGMDNAKMTIKRDAGWVKIEGGGLLLEVDPHSGQIIQGTKDGKMILTGGPHLMMLPLISGPCSTEHSREIEPYNSTCSGWRLESLNMDQDKDGVSVTVSGRYAEAEGSCTIRVENTGNLTVSYDFVCLIDIDPRQTGLVFDLDPSCDRLRWEREARWTVYPANHIGRPAGQALAFPKGTIGASDYRMAPEQDWLLDPHPMGCNDFRATRRNIRRVSLTAESGYGLQVLSDGTQHARSFMEQGASHLLIAGFDTGGADIFLAGHYSAERMKVSPGTKISGMVHLELLAQ